MEGDEIYLDHAASSPMRPDSREAWLAAAMRHHANPTGAHRGARDARRALDDARDAIAAAIGCRPSEVVFTSGGSEADNFAVRGVLAARGGTAVCSAGEHHAVLEPVEHAGGLTFGLRPDGSPDLDDLAAVLDETQGVTIVSVMAVNNETGVISPLPEIARVAREHAPDALLHTDAVQAVQWLDLAETAAEFDLVSITGHKIGGPTGTGALIIRGGLELDPLILGGGQEQGRRAGTPDVAGAVAFATAVTDTVRDRCADVERIRGLRDSLIDGLIDRIGDRVFVTAAPDGDRDHIVAGIAHICLRGIEAEALLFLLDSHGLRASAASSCSAGAQEPSHVLASMGVPHELAVGSLRLSMGPSSTEADVAAALEIIPPAVERLTRYGGG